MEYIGLGITILAMIFLCFFTSGVDWGTAASIFERKSTPSQRRTEEKTVPGARKQSA